MQFLSSTRFVHLSVPLFFISIFVVYLFIPVFDFGFLLSGWVETMLLEDTVLSMFTIYNRSRNLIE